MGQDMSATQQYSAPIGPVLCVNGLHDHAGEYFTPCDCEIGSTPTVELGPEPRTFHIDSDGFGCSASDFAADLDFGTPITFGQVRQHDWTLTRKGRINRASMVMISRRFGSTPWIYGPSLPDALEIDR